MATKKKKRIRQKLSRFKHSPLINDPDFNIAEWAEEHGYTYAAVFNVLNGRTKNKRGEARQIAIDLGMLDENDRYCQLGQRARLSLCGSSRRCNRTNEEQTRENP